MTTPDLPCAHHNQSQTINTVVLRSHLKEISLVSLITFQLSTLKSHKETAALQKMDIFNTDAYEWELDRIFGIWNSAI